MFRVLGIYNFGCIAIAWGFPNAQQNKMSDFIHYWMFFYKRLCTKSKWKNICMSGLTKGNRILRYGCRAFDTFWVPDDIESCNFQNLLVFGFPETSQNLMSFRQLLFSLFHGGDQRKKSENPRKVSNVRHPYLRILFPFMIFQASWTFSWGF